jgi:hypothetical protein
MAMLARFEATQDNFSRRGAARRPLGLQVSGVLPDGPGVDVLIHDLSLTGLLIETWANLKVGTPIEVDLPEAGKTVARVAWGSDRYFGCQFETPISSAVLSAAVLKNPIAPPVTAPVIAPAASLPAVARHEHPGILSRVNRLGVIAGLATVAWAAVFLAVSLA